jgi:cell division protein FtsB
MENGWTKRIEELEAEVGRLQMMNPCNHTGFESAPCDVCGYPDPRNLIAKLKAENKRLAALNDMFPQEIARLEDRVSAEYEAERADDRARIKELEAERDADRKREYGYSQQTVDALTAERDKLTARVKELEESRDSWKREWRLSNAGLDMAEKRIAELEAENHRLIVQRDGAFERWKSATAKYPNGADGCCCLFDDNENQVQWCTPHAELRDENDALTAERDKLTARVKELEAENKRLQIEGRVE